MNLTANLTLEQWNMILGVIEESNAPHLMVREAKHLLKKQLDEEYDQETAKKEAGTHRA